MLSGETRFAVRWHRLAIAAALLFGAGGVAACAQALPEMSSNEATELVQRAVERSLAQAKNHRPMLYELHKVDERHNVTKLIIETKDGDVARLIAVNGKPLTEDANRAELDRLNNLLEHPELQEKRHREEMRDAARVDRLETELPKAFLYKLEGTEPCGGGSPDTCYRLSFTPNPAYTPPDMECDLFRGVAGEVLIDKEQGWMTKLDVHFINDVNLGLGLLAKVDKGGTAVIEQHDVGERAGCGHEWQITAMQLNLAGKVVLFKNMNLHMQQQLSDFKPAPEGIGYRDAIKLLESENETALLR